MSKPLTIKANLLIYLVGIIVLTAILVVSITITLGKVTAQAEYEHTVTDQIVNNIHTTKYFTAQIQQFITDSAATGESDGIEDAQKNLQAAMQSLDAIKKASEELTGSVDSTQSRLKELFETGKHMVSAYDVSREAGNVIMKSTNGFDDQAEKTIDALEELDGKVDHLQELAAQKLESQVAFSTTLVFVLGGFLVVLAAIGGMVIYRRLLFMLGAEPAQSQQLAQQLMQGDLSASIELPATDTQSLIYILLQMRNRWTDVITSLRGKAWLMVEPSHALREKADQLAKNTEEQSKSILDLSEHLYNLSDHMGSIANNAQQTVEQLTGTSDQAAKSSLAIEQMTKSIESSALSVGRSAQLVNVLNQRTEEIVGIVAVIKSIADQTNLLALNAAIEAARAGESGRGFAVVADEVRGLALRVAESTQNIAQLVKEMNSAKNEIVISIELSQNKVQEGVQLSKETTATIVQIQATIGQATANIASINQLLAAQKQRANVAAENIKKITSVADKNMLTSEGVAQAAAQLEIYAKSVSEESGYFKFANDAGGKNAVDLF